MSSSSTEQKCDILIVFQVICDRNGPHDYNEQFKKEMGTGRGKREALLPVFQTKHKIRLIDDIAIYRHWVFFYK